MSDPLPTFATVRVEFNPYSHSEVHKLLRSVYRDYGRDQSRWYYRTANPEDLDTNCWVLDFVFRDPHDAIMFGLKYLR